MQSIPETTVLQQFVAVSRYARWVDEQSRRETWENTVDRWCVFFDEHTGKRFTDVFFNKLKPAIYRLSVMPSMRALMTAGPALARENVAGYNCGYLAIDSKRKFSEALYILMCGTGVGFSCERQEIQALPVIPKDLVACEDVIMVADSKEGWAKAYRKFVSCLYDGDIPSVDYSQVRPAGARLKTFGGRACLTGDTIVYKDRKKSRGQNEITIRDLFDMQNSAGFWAHKPNHFGDVKLRSLDEQEGVFYRNQLLEVIDNGDAPVYEIVTEAGYRIHATDNHRFLRDDGEYQELSEFSVGDLIGVNGKRFRSQMVCFDCGCDVSSKAARCKKCRDVYALTDTASAISARQRKACRDALGTECEKCGHDGSAHNLQRHHVDSNPWNNEPDNLVTLCESCHRKLHAKEWSFGDPYAHKYLSFDPIISITYRGVERVFDLAMEAPNHNFVANGFVSHNSGPAPLRKLFDFTVSMFKKAKGRKLNSLEVHDIMCVIGEIVVVGGVRRSALISLSNLSDLRMREAKTGQWYHENPQRALANNSVAYTEMPNVEIFMEEWLSLIRSKSGERGIFNRVAAQKQASRYGRRSADTSYGTNPCGEILLRDRQFCNLSEVVVRAEDDLASLLAKVETATIIGTIQSTMTNFHFIGEEWKTNTEEERLLGVSLTGIYDNEVMSGRAGTDVLTSYLKSMHDHAGKVNAEWADKLGITPSTAITCVKPSGTVSQLVDSASGIHPRHSKFYLRTVRLDKKDPLYRFMLDNGVYCEDAEGRAETTAVFYFAVKAPKGAVTRNEVSAIDHLSLWSLYQEHWCDHNPSITVTVRDDEWFTVGAWVYSNFDKVCGLAFLPYSDHVYTQAPFIELTEEEYDAWVAAHPEPSLDWNDLSKYEKEDQTIGSQTLACTGDSCSIL